MDISVTSAWQAIALSGKNLQNIGTATIEVAKADAASDGLRMANGDILSYDLWGQDAAYIRISPTSSSAKGQVRLV